MGEPGAALLLGPPVELAEGGEDPTDGACSLGHVGEGFRGALPEKITFEAGNMVFGSP